MKLRNFSVTGKESEAFNWALALFGLSTVMGVVDNWISDPTKDPQSVIDAFQVATSSNPVMVAETLIGVGATLTMWEILRRQLVKDGAFWFNITLIIIMLLTLLTTLVGLPVWGDTAAAVNGSVQLTDFGAFQSKFVNIGQSFIGIARVVFAGELAINYAGMIRNYAVSFFLCPILIGLISLGEYKLYNEVAGMTLPEIATYVNMGSVAQCVLALLPMVLLRYALKNKD